MFLFENIYFQWCMYMGGGGYFSPGEVITVFPVLAKESFCKRDPAVVKFHFPTQKMKTFSRKMLTKSIKCQKYHGDQISRELYSLRRPATCIPR